MDIDRVKQDLEILLALKRQGAIKDVDWNIDGKDNWIIVYGAFPIPREGFNLPDVNIKLVIPGNLYEPVSKERYHFYDTIFIDSKLRRKDRNGWEPIARQMAKMYPKEEAKGWNYLCVFAKYCRENTDVKAVLPIIQRFIITNGRG